MRTFIESRKDSSAGKGTSEHNACSRRAGSAFDTEKQSEYSFLKESFHSVASISLPVCEQPFGQAFHNGKVEWTHDNYIKIDALENVSYLEKTAEAYCKLQCADFNYQRTDNPLVNMSNLLHIVQSVCPSGKEIVLDYIPAKNKVVMLEFAQCEYDTYTLFFLPVSFVNRIPDEVKPIVKKALGIISSVNELETPEEHMDLAYALGCWDDGGSLKETAEEDPEAYEELIKLVNDYLEGDIHNLIAECNIYTKDAESINAEIVKILPKYTGTSVAKLLNILRIGLDLTNEGCWKQYSYTPGHCMIEDFDNHDEFLMDQSRLFALVYDLFDGIVENATDCINAEAGSMNMADFYDFREITRTPRLILSRRIFSKDGRRGSRI